LDAGADPMANNEKGLNAKDFALHAHQSTSVQYLDQAMKEWMQKYPSTIQP
jgi:hypothetical protein